MLTIDNALVRFPPSPPSRCSERKCVKAEPECPMLYGSCVLEKSAVCHKLTFTCDSTTYTPYYYPGVIRCQPVIVPPKRVSCAFRWFDCCGNPVPNWC